MTLQILPAGAIAAGVHHTFQETSLAALVNGMSTAGEPALAEFAFGLNFAHANNRLTNVDLTVRLTIDMPEWSNLANRPAAEQAEWNRFLRALRIHEDGHITIFRSEARKTYTRLLRATPGTIEDVLERERARIQGLSDVYDQQTDHGRTQRTRHGTTVITVPP